MISGFVSHPWKFSVWNLGWATPTYNWAWAICEWFVWWNLRFYQRYLSWNFTAVQHWSLLGCQLFTCGCGLILLEVICTFCVNFSSCCVMQRQMREYLIRLIYCEMLGVDCSWGYIHAVKMTQSHSTLEKRIGTYSTCKINCLHPI